MILGVLLAMGDSFDDMKKSGQDVRFKRYYLSKYSESFERVYIFSYVNEKVSNLPKNVTLVPNKWNIHRYLYSLVLPLINFSTIIKCDVFRVFHLSGTPPAIITRIIFSKPYMFNYAYDYQKFAQIENKIIQKYFYYLLETPAILFANKIFAANKNILAKINHKAIYLPNGVDTKLFKPNKTKTKNKMLQILSVGRLEKQKNYELLMNAIEGVDVKLTIVGNGSLKMKLKKLASEKKVDLKIIDKVSNSQMPKIYNWADMFILLSTIEGSPKALLEAMSCGVPSIVTKMDDVMEIINNKINGLVCEPFSRSIKKNVLFLFNNEKIYNKLKINARLKIIDKYNIDLLIKSEIAVLKNT